MSFTRFHDDPARIQKQLQETTALGRYMLDTPGPGVGLPFYEDPQMRLQHWGANLCTNTVNLESDMFGLTRKFTHDLVDINDYKQHAVPSTQKQYSSAQPMVEESRASHPAWAYKDLDHTRWETPLLDPQANLERPFHHDIQTRILEKDYFKRVYESPILR